MVVLRGDEPAASCAVSLVGLFPSQLLRSVAVESVFSKFMLGVFTVVVGFGLR